MTVRKSMTAYPGHGSGPSPRQGPKVKPEAEANFIKNKGTIKDQLFSNAPITSKSFNFTPRKNVVPYPGHGQRPSPQQGPKVKPEAEANFIKNKGTIKEKLFDDTAPLVVEGKPVPRCPSSAACDNYKLGWNGTVTHLLNGSASPRPYTAPPRVKPEAEETAAIGGGKRMKVIVNEYAKSGPTPREPRVKSEGAATAEVSKGGRMNNILHKYGTLPLSARGVPRVKPEAESIFEMSRGRSMRDSLHSFGQPYRSPKPEPRVKPEAEDNADLDRGRRMKRLLVKYGRDPIRSSSAPRVKSEGQNNADLDRGIRMSRLLHEPRSVPNDPCPLGRNTTPQAKENAFKGRGSMESVFNQIARSTYIHKPGVQSKAFMRASIC